MSVFLLLWPSSCFSVFPSTSAPLLNVTARAQVRTWGPALAKQSTSAPSCLLLAVVLFRFNFCTSTSLICVWLVICHGSQIPSKRFRASQAIFYPVYVELALPTEAYNISVCPVWIISSCTFQFVRIVLSSDLIPLTLQSLPAWCHLPI